MKHQDHLTSADDSTVQDRRLLELAAQAAGYAGRWDDDWYRMSNGRTRWDPLTDDGDALRLAVKLGIDLINFTNGFEPFTCALRPTDKEKEDGFVEPHGPDPCAATRRAIVRAAAALAQERSGQVDEPK